MGFSLGYSKKRASPVGARENGIRRSSPGRAFISVFNVYPALTVQMAYLRKSNRPDRAHRREADRNNGGHHGPGPQTNFRGQIGVSSTN
jgi:hypothetical protein